MAQLKAQLEAAGYDTSGLDEAGLLQRLDQAGYDTSTLTGAESPNGGQTAAEATPSEAPKESKTRRFIRGVAKALPVVGAIGGSFVAPVAGTASGAAAGYATKEAILSALGDQAPTLGEVTGRVAKGTAIDTALTLAGMKAFKGLGAGAKLAKDLIVKPGAAEVAQLGKEALIDIGEKGAEKLALARATKEAAKEGLIKAEEKAGLHFLSTPEFESAIADPKRVARVSESLARLADKTPEELSQLLSPQQLQNVRKFAQEAEKVSGLSDIAKSQLRRGKDIVTQALGKSQPEIGEQLSRFREADKVVGDIPGEIKAKLASQKIANARQVLDAKALDTKRKVVKGLAGAAAGYFGLKSLLK